MADSITLAPPLRPETAILDDKLKPRSNRRALAVFAIAVIAGLSYIVVHVSRDLDAVKTAGSWPYMLLGLALMIALGFEFVNGFHDTANAVATVMFRNRRVYFHATSCASCARNIQGLSLFRQYIPIS